MWCNWSHHIFKLTQIAPFLLSLFSLLIFYLPPGIIVHMNEQKVPHTEPVERQQDEGASVANVPAPMVERAFRVLDLVSAAEDGLTLSELARALNMSKGSMHGLLKTLESTGALEQSEERTYMLGPRIYDLAQSYVSRAGLRRFALPAMHRLAEQIGETVILGRVEERGVRIIEIVMDEHEQVGLRISARRGSRIPLMAGAAARVVLANRSAVERVDFLKQQALPRFTERSITDPTLLLEAIEQTALSGIGIDRGEYLEGVNAVAAPLYGPTRSLIALLWIVGFASRLTEPALERAAGFLRLESEFISRSLGGQ
jgi:DNA-binding IclR family transcriptional regulator